MYIVNTFVHGVNLHLDQGQTENSLTLALLSNTSYCPEHFPFADKVWYWGWHELGQRSTGLIYIDPTVGPAVLLVLLTERGVFVYLLNVTCLRLWLHIDVQVWFRIVTGCNPNDLDIWTDWCHDTEKWPIENRSCAGLWTITRFRRYDVSPDTHNLER